MVSVVTMNAEWFSLADMIKLRELTVLFSVKLKEWQYKVTLDEIGDQVWDGLTEEMAEHLYEDGNSLALKKKCATSCSRLYLCEIYLDLRGETGQGSIKKASER